VAYLVKSSKVGKGKVIETIDQVLLEVETILRDRVHGMKRGKIIITYVDQQGK